MPEMNMGQLALLVRGTYLVDAHSYTAVRGLPFSSAELVEVIASSLAALDSNGAGGLPVAEPERADEVPIAAPTQTPEPADTPSPANA